MKLLFLDTETTGLNPAENKIIDISAQLIETNPIGWDTIDSWHHQISYHNSKVGPISLGALVVNGRTVEQIIEASEETLDYDYGFQMFATWLVGIKRRHKHFVVAGHNVHFDVSFIKNALESVGFVDVDAVLGHRFVDTASIAMFLKDLSLIKAENTNMEALSTEFGLPNPPHTATGDTQQTIVLYQKMKELVKPRGIVCNDIPPFIST